MSKLSPDHHDKTSGGLFTNQEIRFVNCRYELAKGEKFGDFVNLIVGFEDTSGQYGVSEQFYSCGSVKLSDDGISEKKDVKVGMRADDIFNPTKPDTPLHFQCKAARFFDALYVVHKYPDRFPVKAHDLDGYVIKPKGLEGKERTYKKKDGTTGTTNIEMYVPSEILKYPWESGATAGSGTVTGNVPAEEAEAIAALLLILADNPDGIKKNQINAKFIQKKDDLGIDVRKAAIFTTLLINKGDEGLAAIDGIIYDNGVLKLA